MAQQPIMKELPELESDIRRPKFSDILVGRHASDHDDTSNLWFV